MFLLRRLPVRRIEFLFSLLLILGMLGIARLAQAQHLPELAFWLVQLILEFVIPVATGVIAAGLLAGDPALDLVLSAHRPAWQALAERLLFLGCIGTSLGTVTILLAENWGLALPKDGPDRIFIWLSPLIFCMGLSSASALLRGRMVDGVLATMGWMGLSLILLPQIPRGCAENLSGNACAWWLVSPLMTLGDAQDAFWPLNRLLWFGLGTLLLVTSFLWVQREEQLLHESPSQ